MDSVPCSREGFGGFSILSTDKKHRHLFSLLSHGSFNNDECTRGLQKLMG